MFGLGNNKKNEENSIVEKLTGREIQLAPSFQSIFEEETGQFISEKKEKSFKSVKKFKKSLKNESGISKSKKGRGGINFEVIWAGIAVGLLLGAVLFYFQGLQPIILNKYIKQSNERIDQLSEKYVSQLTSVQNLQNSLVKNSVYDQFLSCEDNTLYTSMQDDSNLINIGDTAVLPAPVYKNLSNYQMFYLQDVRDIYGNLYQDYSSNLEDLSQIYSKIKKYPTYFEYRNSWINSCKEIKAAAGNTQKIKDICTILNAKTATYEAGDKVEFWNEMKGDVDTALSKCDEVNNVKTTTFPSYNTWLIDWIDSYSRIVGYQPDYESNTEKLNQSQAEFKSSAEKAKNDVTKVYNDKINLADIWYVLGIEL